MSASESESPELAACQQEPIQASNDSGMTSSGFGFMHVSNPQPNSPRLPFDTDSSATGSQGLAYARQSLATASGFTHVMNASNMSKTSNKEESPSNDKKYNKKMGQSSVLLDEEEEK